MTSKILDGLFYLLAILAFVLLGMVFAVKLQAYADTPDYTDDADERHPHFAGRLHIPDVGIDVALYRSNLQATVDRQDSAAYFDLAPWQGHMLVADHNTQAFGPLLDVTVGMTCYIVHPDGTETHYICVDVFDGHNTGKYISDASGKIVMARADLLMYTCLDHWRNVRICLFDRREKGETDD